MASEKDSGKTFWDLVGSDNTIKVALIFIVAVIVGAFIFFSLNGYSITTGGITPPDHRKDSTFHRATPASILPKNEVTNLQQFDKLAQLAWISIFILVVLLLLVVLVFYLQMRSKKTTVYNVSAEKKVMVFEHLYNTCISFSLYDRERSQELLIEVQALTKFTVENGLYIDKPLEKLVKDVTDYFKEVMVDYGKKDVAKEKQLQERFKRLFQ